MKELSDEQAKAVDRKLLRPQKRPNGNPIDILKDGGSHALQPCPHRETEQRLQHTSREAGNETRRIEVPQKKARLDQPGHSKASCHNGENKAEICVNIRHDD